MNPIHVLNSPWILCLRTSLTARDGFPSQCVTRGRYALHIWLPLAHEVRRKVIFMLVTVCLSTFWGLLYFYAADEGYPCPSLGGTRVPPFQVRMLGTPIWLTGGRKGEGVSSIGTEWGYPPVKTEWDTHSSIRTGWEYPPPSSIRRQSSRASTCYVAGGMLLAFTQEDFLVFFVLIIDPHLYSCTWIFERHLSF